MGNRVLELHQCPYLDEFRVSFDMNRDASHDIDEWINFAIPKGLKRLEIDFTSYFSGSDNCYSLSQRCYSCFKSPHNLSRIKSLNSLTLKDVNVNGELLEFLLSNCPLLEFLCVYCSEHIVNLKVAGPSLRLKHLEIFRCMHLESLDVSAPKLGNEEIPKALEFTTLKHLNISICIFYDKSLLGFTSLLEAAPSLRTFTLQASATTVDQAQPSATTPRRPATSGDPTPVLADHLRAFSGHRRLCLYSTKSVYEVQRFGCAGAFKIVICWLNFQPPGLASSHSKRPFPLAILSQVLSLHPSMQRVPEVLTPRPHQCLKVVEMIGFSGGTTDLEFFTYLLQSAINLDKIIFDPYHPREFKGEKSEEKDEARKRARQLAKRLPPGVKSAVL
ncbi:hypothetical protein RHMOL_Rhmol08G0245100 [Rhododendron molle]|uniref:Uncharacterized protein n=1 Tax=Rhododendron molle TaxID=49168 RepID=A0ACC0MSP7_RHOML|nr:hypothetical protein RHMOL_Rhmol08G0245100 [Rhododendron molle]